jgi:hypothetical protein
VEYAQWVAYALLTINVVLICLSFTVRPETGKLQFRPWYFAYSVVIFVLWALVDTVVKMKFLE